MKFDVYGKQLIVERSDDEWIVFYPGEGKRRLAHDIIIPSSLTEEEIEGYLEDLFHEAATPHHSDVRRLE